MDDDGWMMMDGWMDGCMEGCVLVYLCTETSLNLCMNVMQEVGSQACL